MNKFAGISAFWRKCRKSILSQICLDFFLFTQTTFDLHLRLTKTHSQFPILPKIKANLWLVCFCTSVPQNFPWLILHLTNTQNQFHILSKINGNSHEFVQLAVTKTENQFCANKFLLLLHGFLRSTGNFKPLGDFPQKPERRHEASSCFQDFKILDSKIQRCSSDKFLSIVFENFYHSFYQSVLV